MKVRFVNFGKQYLQHKKEIDKAITRCLTDGDLILRKDLEEFEKKFAKYIGVKYAVGLNSGTDALYLALKASGIGKGDEVLVSSHTFVASVQVIVQCGAKPILYEQREDGGILITDKITKNTKAIITCHIAGKFEGNMNSLMPIVKKYNLVLIEDSCQSLGATQNGKKAGSFGIGCFSFYPAKILGAFGDGGMITTNDKKIADEARELRNHYKKDYSKWGINSRLDNIQAAVLNVKLKYLSKILERRKEIAKMYLKEFSNWVIADYKDAIGLPEDRPGRVWQDFVINIGSRRDTLYTYLKKKGIETMKNEYPMPIKKLPETLEYEASTLRIPCNETLTEKEVDYVIKSIKKFYERKGSL